jgi:hypothetical protein
MKYQIPRYQENDANSHFQMNQPGINLFFYFTYGIQFDMKWKIGRNFPRVERISSTKIY